ncbi:serpin family protein [Sphingobacterium olei]|uniref:Serpin family protein n=1 Tax=Sphingobacterium olei TaxID=2571155 RepID=A0A4U0P0M1_9SPHI|nr:serpin family protein [Sphingobacterium olei]TJZ60052.1 serpin family protein [Sphingobacterium olei]
MNRKTTLWIIFATLVLFSSCEKKDIPFDERNLELTAAEKQLVDLNNEFAFDMMAQLSGNITANENLFFSPLSVGAALTMTSNGAKGETLSQMQKALNMDGIDAELVNAYYKKLITDLPYLNAKTNIEIANSIWYTNEFSVRNSFLDMNRNYFNAEISPLDFSNPQALNRINGWVNEKTKTKIPSILDQIPGDVVMYLINAIYFKGAWDYKFDKSKTKKEDFKKSDGEVIQTDFMETEHTFNTASTTDYEAIQLPYTDRKFDMVLVKSKPGKSLDNLKATFQDPAAIKSLVEGLRGTKAKVHLPKFKISYESSLAPMLVSFGMVKPFNVGADFTGITENGGVYISDVKHKAFVEVSEEGTEAAAVTIVGIELTSMPQPQEPIVIRFDEPFLFFIREASSGLVLFAGQINDPTRDATKK